MSAVSDSIIKATRKLSRQMQTLEFPAPVAFVYNPLVYARAVHENYIKSYAGSSKRVLFLGMNPGPFGMAQTGVPFGDVHMVQEWLKLKGTIRQPTTSHPKRPVEGFSCQRSEVSGTRLWGLFQERFGSADVFFRDHYVSNYCPLLFLNAKGANLTPDKISRQTMQKLYEYCDQFLLDLLSHLKPEYVIGIGNFACQKLKAVLVQLQAKTSQEIQLARILHPSPASPAANRGWAPQAVRQMCDAGVWDK